MARALLVWAAVALVLSTLLQRGLERVGAYRLVWHRPLFDLALLVLVTGALVAGSRWISP